MLWIAKRSPQPEPTSLLARGTYDQELFRWSNAWEEYEIVLDNLGLDDIGFSLGDQEAQ